MINIDADTKNADWPKRTPDTFADLGLVKKREYVRDEKGRFAETASITVGDRQIEVVKPRRAASDKLVPLHVLPFDQRFAGDPNFYLGVGGGKNAIGDRYKRFGEFIASHYSIEASEVYVGDDGRVGFTNGRHRYAWLRDHGLTSIPVAMDEQSVRNAKKFGYLAAVKMAWDESQHPRDKEGQFTTFYHGTVQEQIDSIKEHGLQMSYSGLAWPGLSQPGTVYLGRTRDAAMMWAESATLRLEWKFDNPTAVVLEIRVPDEVLAKSQRTAEPEGNLRVFQDIPPEWIVDVTVGRSHDQILGVTRARMRREEAKPIVPPFVTKAETFYVGLVIEGEPRVQKQEHKFGNTQIQIDAHSSAAATLNSARNTIRDEHLMGAGKDVDPNHLTVRYGLLNEDLNKLRSFIAHQTPFEAQVVGIELFPASEHSDGAVPVVARIASPDLRIIEEEIGKHADFKEKNFPEYKPHCTLAYVDPLQAPKYQDLYVGGSFLVHGIMISHQSGVKETIPFGMTQKKQWDESKHRRQPKGSGHGGEFAGGVFHAAKDALDSLLNKETNISIQRDDVRTFIQLAGEQHEDPDLTDLQVEGMEIFGGNGLGIERDDMPQIPPSHRERFLDAMESAGVELIAESVDPLTLKPTQNKVSARKVAAKIKEYEENTGKAFPPVLVSKTGRILDGHHHWGMMAVLAVDIPSVKVPIFRLNVSTKRALALMHRYMQKHKLERSKSFSEKWDEVLHPRDEEGKFTNNPARAVEIEAAIRRGEAHTVSEGEFVRYHFTGAIESNAYERYEAGEMDFIHRKDFDTLLETREVNGQTVEIRLQAETPTYGKRRLAAPAAERDRLYEEYEQAAKKLGTTPMMAGLDLGRDSEAYKELGVFEQRWLQSGEGYVRDAHGNVVPLTPEEAKAQGLPAVNYTVAAFIGDKAVGYAGDEFGASGVYVARAAQRHGIGLTLLKTYLEKSGRLAKGRQIGQMTGVGQALLRALHRQLVKEAAVKKADPATGRYVTPFVSFDKQGDDQLRMIASLNSSRLATWGFTAEAEVRGMARYRLSAVLDGRTSDFCRLVDGKIFQVEDAREKVIEALNVQNPEDLRVVQPWPKQTKAALKEFRVMTPDQLTALGFHIPPYHPYCRTICRIIEGSEGEEMEEVATVPEDAEVFQPVTQADLKELGVEATPEQVAQWNEHIGMSPVELISKLTGMAPQEVMTKGKGVGANPVQFDASGNIGIRAHGESLNGIEFKLGAILDPFTGIYYLSQAELLAGTPKAELAFLKNLFLEMINIGQKSTATSVAVGVAGNAAYYAKLGFLPDDLEWDSLRSVALSELEVGALKPVLASLAPQDALLVKQLLQDGSSSALSALVELPFKYQGKTIGQWILEQTTGTWELDLMDAAVVSQAKAYLS